MFDAAAIILLCLSLNTVSQSLAMIAAKKKLEVNQFYLGRAKALAEAKSNFCKLWLKKAIFHYYKILTPDS